MENKNIQETNTFKAIIVAGGSGQRLENDIPKQYHRLGNIHVLDWSIQTFLNMNECEDIVLVINPAHKTFLSPGIMNNTRIKIVDGGSTRFKSFINGLRTISNPKNDIAILVHDAARPFVRAKHIRNLVSNIYMHNASALAVRVTDTIQSFTKNGESSTLGQPINRDGHVAMQTPQGALYSTFNAALTWLNGHNPDGDYPDESTFLKAAGYDVTVTTGSKDNFKITSQDDMNIAQTIANQNTAPDIRVGYGYDIHAFHDEITDTTIKIGGIDVPHNKKINAHSDGDVVLHALTDALLGTIGDGDIGTHFPPSDPKWKDADSKDFIKDAIKRVHEKNGRINHVDICIVCEKPKIGPHRQDIMDNLARLFKLPQDRIGLKATTSEKMGYVGEERGLKAYAHVTVNF